MSKGYDPRKDPVVQKLKRARSEAARKSIEKNAVVQTDNGRKPTDPKGRVSQAKKPRSI